MWIKYFIFCITLIFSQKSVFNKRPKWAFIAHLHQQTIWQEYKEMLKYYKKPFVELQKDASTYLQYSFTKIRPLIAEEQLISNVSVIVTYTI